MSNTIFTSINPNTTSGIQLAQILNDFRDAYVSGNSGSARPAGIAAGGCWVDDTLLATQDLLILKMYDGAGDITLFTVNTVSNTASIASSDSSFEISKVSADTIGAILSLAKARIANGGQVLVGDVIGELDFKGKTNTGVTTIQGKLKVISNDSVSTSAQGSYLALELINKGTNSLVEALRVLDGRIGVGETSPESAIHVTSDTGIKSARVSADAVAPILEVHKKRIATNGQTLNNDELGSVVFSGTDQLGAKVQVAKVNAVALENTSDTAQGASLVVSVKGVGSTSYTSVMTITAAKVIIPILETGNANFTGTVTGITKTMVGLSNVDNTSDANKPVSTATQTEINTKTAIPASVSIPLLAINWQSGNLFYKSVSSNTTFTFSNIVDGKVISVAVENTSGGSVSLTFPTDVEPPSFDNTVSAGTESIFTFMSMNGKVYAVSVNGAS